METPAEVTPTDSTTQPQAESNVMDVEKVDPSDKKTTVTPSKKTPPKKNTPRKQTPKKAIPPKTPPKPQPNKEAETGTLKRTRSKSQTNWSDLIYGSGEKYVEGDTLAVRAPKESGEQFWLCILDGVGTEENPEDLEITWFESKGSGVYVEGEEDDISAETVICKTRLNMNVSDSGTTWVLPQAELKSIRDALKLEKEESSDEDRKEEEFSEDDEESEQSIKEGDEEQEGSDLSNQEKRASLKSSGSRGSLGEGKRKGSSSNLDANGEPKPKRQYKKREKKVAPTETTTTATTNNNINNNYNIAMADPTMLTTPVWPNPHMSAMNTVLGHNPIYMNNIPYHPQQQPNLLQNLSTPLPQQQQQQQSIPQQQTTTTITPSNPTTTLTSTTLPQTNNTVTPSSSIVSSDVVLQQGTALQQ